MKYLILVLILASCATNKKVSKDGDVLHVTREHEGYVCEFSGDYWVFDSKLDRDNFCK